ncbi:MAG: nucleotidyltransferase [Steroidobacteraceae bacterium]|nr:nucleotidyltransferase [Steroidobacteraceae bacterium]MCW5571620.1 nucleotidyltransferase [Steroidobacteraceae bacterium]
MAHLNRLIERLTDAGIDFVVVGGFAGMLHGSTLVTRDLDVCVVLSADNVARLREAFRDLRPRHRFASPKHSFLDNPEPGVALNNLYLETELGPIDFLGSIKGVGDFECVRAGSIEIELFGRRCRVMSIESLIQAKQAMGRDKDMIAVKELRAIAEKQRRE